jgi:N-acetylglucosamine-6-phosphate deacetylase
MARAVDITHELAGTQMTDRANMTSLTPALVVGVADRKGSLEAGKDADIVLLDDDLQVRMTICRGEIAYQAPRE